jgi:hypothetical protein
MSPTRYNGSRRDVLLLLGSSGYADALNQALEGSGTVVRESDRRRPIGPANDTEYELPEFCREYLDGWFDVRQLEPPQWWIATGGRFATTPNFDLLSTATIEGSPGILLVEAKAHHSELETGGKPLKQNSSVANHHRIGESISMANDALNAVAAGFALSRDRFYQVSNRVSWGWRLASLGVPVTLLYLGFVQDPYWPLDGFRASVEWRDAARGYLANVVPDHVVGQRLRIGARGSLAIAIGALPAVPD